MLLNKVFIIRDGECSSPDMDSFISCHKIINTVKQYNMNNSYWSYSVEYNGTANDILSNSDNVNIKPSNSSEKKHGKIDYLMVLSREHFARFSVLRKARADIAKEESTNEFIIITNELAAEAVKNGDVTLKSLKDTKGFGEEKYKKYSDKLVKYYNKHYPDNYDHYLLYWDKIRKTENNVDEIKSSDVNNIVPPEVPDKQTDDKEQDDVPF